MSLLILGSTGTLGRQIVRKALDEGFQVRCFVRNFRKAVFLKDWGAELVYGDLRLLETIPRSLYGVTAIIDASTTRSVDFNAIRMIELDSKKALIEAAKLAGVQRYVFFSILNAQNYQNILLMKLKIQMQDELVRSGINYTIFNLCGFFQGVIHQYALPILDNQSIWVTQEVQAIPYVDTQDVAKFAIKSLSMKVARNQAFSLIGHSKWTSSEIIELCEKLSGQKSKISKIPLFVLQLLREATKFFQWTWSISERLAFTNVFLEKELFNLRNDSVYNIFHIRFYDLNSLENYLQDYFSCILQRMKELTESRDSEVDFTSF